MHSWFFSCGHSWCPSWLLIKCLFKCLFAAKAFGQSEQVYGSSPECRRRCSHKDLSELTCLPQISQMNSFGGLPCWSIWEAKPFAEANALLQAVQLNSKLSQCCLSWCCLKDERSWKPCPHLSHWCGVSLECTFKCFMISPLSKNPFPHVSQKNLRSLWNLFRWSVNSGRVSAT